MYIDIRVDIYTKLMSDLMQLKYINKVKYIKCIALHIKPYIEYILLQKL